MAPENPVPVVSLAAVLLQRQAPGAARLFERIAHEHDLREAWLGLAAACKTGRRPGRGRRRPWPGRFGAAHRARTRPLSRPPPQLPGCRCPRMGGTSQQWTRVGRARREQRSTGTPRHHAGRGARNARPRDTVAAAHGAPLSGRLPDTFAAAQRLEVELGGRALLGSPIAIPAITRVEGFVEATDNGLAGWVWRPGDPEADVHLGVGRPTGAANTFDVRARSPMRRGDPITVCAPRGFIVPAERLAGLGAVRVIGPDGRDLLGSPLDRGAEQRSAASRSPAVPSAMGATTPPARGLPGHAACPTPAVAAARATRPLTPSAAVVMPVYRGREVTLAALAAVVETVGPDTPIIVVDDATPEPALAQALDGLADAGRIRLIRHTRNRGFPAAANTGIRAAAGRDVVLLNSDTLVAGDWIHRLRTAAYAAPEVATATPLSNNATILSYPDVERPNPAPALEETRQLDALAAAANGDGVVEIPTAVGFCMYVRRDCLDEVGLLREDVFAQGYGEENDFCLRARHRGWRHVAATGVFVAHLGGQSFGAAPDLVARNLKILNQLHPGYDQLIRDFVADDPLAPARKRLDAARWSGGSRRTPGGRDCHTRPGRRCGAACPGTLPGDRARGPSPRGRPPGSARHHARVPAQPGCRGHPSEFGVPAARGGRRPGRAPPAGAADTRRAAPRAGPPGRGARAGYATGRPARGTAPRLRPGLPPRYPRGHHAAVLRRAGPADLRGLCDRRRRPQQRMPWPPCGHDRRHCCAARRAPSRRQTIRRGASRGTFPTCHELLCRPGRAEAPVPPRAEAHRRPGSRARTRVCVVGAISADKGYDVLLAAAADAAQRRLPLEFVVVGHTCDDERLLATGRAWVTGEFAAAEAEELIRAQAADLAWLPSIWPETWCYALSDAWQAGLNVVAFDVGAPAERIRTTGRGWLFPLGMPTAAFNDALLHLAGTWSAGHADAPPHARGSTV